MARRKNPESTLPMLILLGAAAVYLFNKSSSTGGGTIGPITPVGPISPESGSNPALVKQIQVALLYFLQDHPNGPDLPNFYTGQFDQATADAYVMMGNIVTMAMQNAPASRQVLPTGTFGSDLTIPIVGATDPSRTSQRVSKALLAWLIEYYGCNLDIDPNVTVFVPPKAYRIFSEYFKNNMSKMHPEDRLLLDTEIALYPNLYPAYNK